MADPRDRDDTPEDRHEAGQASGETEPGPAPLGMGRGYGRDVGAAGLNQGADGSWGQGYGGTTAFSDYRDGINGRGGGVQTSGETAFRSFQPQGEDIASGAGDRPWLQVREDADLREDGPYRGRGPQGWSRSDQRIHEHVCEALTESPLLDAREIEVEVEDGVVTLRGEVPQHSDPHLAESLARRSSGVKDVRVELTVSGEPRRERSGGLDRDAGPVPGSMSGNSVAGQRQP